MEGGQMMEKLTGLLNRLRRRQPAPESGGPENSGGGIAVAAAFLLSLLIALCLCWMAESALMSRSLASRLRLAEEVAKRQPSFANAGSGQGLTELTELNPFGADTPQAAASNDTETAAYQISSLMLAGTLPHVGAWIRDDAGTTLVLKGQEIRGFKVEDVSYGKVLLSKNGDSYPLYLVLSGGSAPLPPPAAKPGGPRPKLDLSAIQPAGDGKEGLVPRELVDKLIMNPYDEMAKMRMVPAEGGGMKLERIAPDSVLGTVGVTQGDVIKAINGVNISNMGDAANAINSMMSGSRFDVTVDRGGKPLDLKYQVK